MEINQMSNTSTNFSQAINHNEETLQFRIPALVFLSFILPFGVLGNAIVIYIYGFRLERTNVFFFITLLAISDITSCVMVIPLELLRLREFFVYPSDSLCRWHTLVFFMCYIYSTFLLLIISVERYVKVCQSTIRQMKFKVAKLVSIVGAIVSVIFALPSGAWAHRSIYSDGDVIHYKCSMYSHDPILLYSLSVFIFSLITWTTMLTLYILLLKTIKKQAAWNLQWRDDPNPKPETEHSSLKRLGHTNRAVLCLSLVYVTTFSFYFCFVLVNHLTTKLKDDNNIHYFLFLLNESWVINIAFNPIVYGFLNTKFRIEIYKLISMFCKPRDPQVEPPDYETTFAGYPISQTRSSDEKSQTSSKLSDHAVIVQYNNS